MSPRRLFGLDVLRAVAVLLVLGRHAEAAANAAGPWNAPLRLWHQVGWAGVDLFFVLSGFLVSGLLFAEYRRDGRVRLGRFLARRGFRIYPAFYVLLLATLAMNALGGEGSSRAATVSEALFLQSYRPKLWEHTWSLSVEEHFYLLLAAWVGFALFRRRHRERVDDPFRGLPLLFAGVAAASLAARIATSAHTSQMDEYLFPTHLRLDSLLLGVLVAYCYYFHRERLAAFVRCWRWALVAALPVLAWLPLTRALDDRLVHTVGLSALYVACGIVLLLTLHAEPASRHARATLAPLAWLGASSYSIYLWHFPVRAWGGHALRQLTGPLPPAGEVAVYVVACVGFGWAMGRVIEMPFLAIRDRVIPSAPVIPSGREGSGPAAPEPAPSLALGMTEGALGMTEGALGMTEGPVGMTAG